MALSCNYLFKAFLLKQRDVTVMQSPLRSCTLHGSFSYDVKCAMLKSKHTLLSGSSPGAQDGRARALSDDVACSEMHARQPAMAAGDLRTTCRGT
jgi:hypothetical protein